MTGYALIIAAAITWGFWPIILQRAESHGPLVGALESTVVLIGMTIFSAPLLLWDRTRSPARSVRGWLGVAWLGASDAFNILLLFVAYQKTSVAIAVLTHYLAPILIALASPWILGERMERRTMLAIGISFAGLLVALNPFQTTLGRSDLIGAAAGAGSAVCYASNVFVQKRVRHEFSGSELNFFHGFVGVPILAALVPRSAWGALSIPAVGWLALGALLPGTLASIAFLWGMRMIPASRGAALTLLEPLTAIVVAMLFLGQHPTIHAFSGGALILLGAMMVLQEGAKSS